MDKKRRRSILALILALALGNYFRIHGRENIGTVHFLSILFIGVLAGILLSDLVAFFKNRKGDKDKMI